MARPRKENAEYFSHDTNMRSHRKIIALRWKFWIQWYAVYCMLLEHIWSCDFFQSKRDDIEQEVIAWDFGVSVADLVDVVNFCVRMDLIQISNNNITCISLVDRLSDLIEKRNRERNREKLKEEKQNIITVAETNITVAEIPQSKVKEIKGNKRKENNIFVPPSLQEVVDYFSANGYSTETAERAYKGYDVADRHDSTGKKISNRKQKMVQVRFKPENAKKYTKTEYLQIEAERERDKVWTTAKYWDAVIKKAIAFYNENN